MKERELFWSLIRNQICGEELGEEIKAGINSESLDKLYAISKKYDVAAIVASALSKCSVSFNASSLFNNEIMLSVTRYKRMQHEFEVIMGVFEEAKIAYIPLKGAVIRDLYPERWMRTSCDIDILVKEEELDRAVDILCEKLSYKSDRQKAYHDISLFSPSGIHLELHYNICENSEKIDTLLSKVWSYAAPETSDGYRYVLSPEFMIFHIIAHASYHFLAGGCGIRAFIDLYLLESKLSYDSQVLLDFCRECSVDKFQCAAEKLSRVWLANEEENELTSRLEEYIFSGGLYGNKETRIILSQGKSGSTFTYIMRRIFMPYKNLSIKYPKLKKYPILTPFYQVKRWFSVLFSKKAKSAKAELSLVMTSDKEKNEQIMNLIDELGL